MRISGEAGLESGCWAYATATCRGSHGGGVRIRAGLGARVAGSLPAARKELRFLFPAWNVCASDGARRGAYRALVLPQEPSDVFAVAGVLCLRDTGVAFGHGGGGGSPGGGSGGDGGCSAGAPGSAGWREDSSPLASAAQGAGPQRTGNREGAVCGTTPRLRADRSGISQSLRPGRGPDAVVRMVRRAGTAHTAASRRLHSGLGCDEGGAFLTSEPPTIDGPRSSANFWPEECSNRHSVNMKAGRPPRNRLIRSREQVRRDPCGQWLRQHADANIRRQVYVAASSNKNGRT